MPVHELCRKAHGVACDRLQAVFVDAARRKRAQLDVKAQRLPKRRPKRCRVPHRQHARQADGDVAFVAELLVGVIRKEELLALFKEIGHGVFLRVGVFELLAHLAVFGVSYDLSLAAAVARDVGAAVAKGYERAVAVVGAKRAGQVRLLRIGERIDPLKADKAALEQCTACVAL